MFKRALSDTLRQASGPGGILIFLLTLAGPTLATLVTNGVAAVSWDAVVLGLASFGVAAVTLFSWNLVATPFRMEREKRVETEKRLEIACAERAALQEGANFRLEIDIIGVNGNRINEGFPALAIMAARNVGLRSSALEYWGMEIVTVDGEIIPMEIFHQHGPFRGTNHLGNPITWAENDAIYLKTIEPVKGGSVARGFMVCFSPNPRAGALAPGDLVRVRCLDVFGKEWKAERLVDVGGDQHVLNYPGMAW